MPRVCRNATLGYGRSACPSSDVAHDSESKRAMARTLQKMMGDRGYDQFAVVGHDRGARVAYRMALDLPETWGTPTTTFPASVRDAYVDPLRDPAPIDTICLRMTQPLESWTSFRSDLIWRLQGEDGFNPKLTRGMFPS